MTVPLGPPATTASNKKVYGYPLRIWMQPLTTTRDAIGELRQATKLVIKRADKWS